MVNKYTKADGIERLRREKGQEGTIGGLFYALLEQTDQKVIDKIENHFGEVIAAGYNIGATINDAEKDPVKKKQMAEAIFKAAQGASKSFEDEE